VVAGPDRVYVFHDHEYLTRLAHARLVALRAEARAALRRELGFC
jgi:hypothetical protein